MKLKDYTIEEKAKAYDEILKKAKTFNIKGYINEECLYDMFPQLKESEDEKVRKGLLKMFHHYMKDNTELVEYDLEKDKVIAWLEKQGTTIQFFSDEFEWELSRIIAFWNKTHKDGIYDENELMSYVKVRETELIKLFTDNACKVSLSDCSEEYRNAYYDGYNKCNRDWLEEQGRQKSADKVKPKFHEGDILKHNRANIICEVISANNGLYQLRNILGGDEMELSNVENNFHLWTIVHDAKDGDVLAVNGRPFIYNGNVATLFVGGYCGITIYNSFYYEKSVGDDNDRWAICDNYIYPATEEQRDFLFQKMKEAGYEWDANEKKLKKIEQK